MLFAENAVPATPADSDTGAVSLGVKFQSSVGGQVVGVRFYQGPTNTGTHTGTLWSATGQVLATGTFTGESATGWQTLVFSQPVAVVAGTEYVASYFAPSGHYSATSGFFAQPYSNGPLNASGANGRYTYSATSAFPTQMYNATNYWVDPVFLTGTPLSVPALMGRKGARSWL